MAPTMINLLESVDRQIGDVFRPYLVGDVNDSQVRIRRVPPAVTHERAGPPEFENSTTVNTGNASSDLTVTEPDRLN